MKRITPFLLFDGKAEEAMNFYVSVFKNAKAGEIRRFGESGPAPKGTVLSASFEIEGQEFVALNVGPHYEPTPAISFFVDCKTQTEVDDLWDKLSAGGQVLRCGWVTDRYGLTWQIVPSGLGEMLQDRDPDKSSRVWKAMMQMDKLDIVRLRDAYEAA